eukprot:Hpha_TRINITY_DN5996_c0_g1::TRINITY_DN5996_c0_g1_i2::g.147343::m.147343
MGLRHSGFHPVPDDAEREEEEETPEGGARCVGLRDVAESVFDNCGTAFIRVPVPQAVTMRRKPRRKVLIVGVGGPRGCRSSEISRRLRFELDSPLRPIEMDWFRDRQRMPQGPDGRPHSDSAHCVDLRALMRELTRITRLLARVTVVPASLSIESKEPAPDLVIDGWELERLGDQTVVVIVEGSFIFLDRILNRMFDCAIWLDSGHEACKMRRWEREKNGRFAGRSWTTFSEWFDAVVWSEQMRHQQEQLGNAKRRALLRLCSDGDDTELVARAGASHVNLLLRGLAPAPDPSLRTGLETPPSSEEDFPG